MYNLSSLLQQRSPKVGQTLFIAVDGHGGSGKSSFANKLSEYLKAEIIHTDDFASSDNPINWHPSLIEKVFLPISNGDKELHYSRSKWLDDNVRESVSNQPVTNIMVLEGVSSLRKEFRDYISLGIFVDTPREVCLQRGVERDLKSGKSKDEILGLWSEWLNDEDAYFERDEPKKYADIILDGTKPFEEQITF